MILIFALALLLTPHSHTNPNPNANNPVVDVPVILVLAPPASTAPGTNHLKVDIDVSGFADDTAQTRIAGTSEAMLRLNISDPANPLIEGIKFTGGSFDTLDAINLNFSANVIFVAFNVNVASSVIGGTVLSPTGMFAPVVANMFALANQSILLNEGNLTATGSYRIGLTTTPVNENIDLALNPIQANGIGTGNTSIGTLSETSISYTYAVSLEIPVDLMDTIPVDDGGTINITFDAEGTIVASGTATVFCLPTLTPIGQTPAGLDLEINGEIGDICDLCWSDDLVNWNFLSTINLSASPISTFTDAASLATQNRFYKLSPPSGP
ncbi:MAG: hypothetical protein AAGD22_09840 [Verrucomicrobiota bacterium]